MLDKYFLYLLYIYLFSRIISNEKNLIYGFSYSKNENLVKLLVLWSCDFRRKFHQKLNDFRDLRAILHEIHAVSTILRSGISVKTNHPFSTQTEFS